MRWGYHIMCHCSLSVAIRISRVVVFTSFTSHDENDLAGDEDDDQTIRATLGKLLFSGSNVGKPTSVISGGEKHRMYFGKLMLLKANVLLLDEPTNHLDMESIESLQLALEKFDGTVLVVSHDREFVNSIAKRIWIIDIDQNKIHDFSGTYDEYLATKVNC